jgi:predicted transporter
LRPSTVIDHQMQRKTYERHQGHLSHSPGLASHSCPLCFSSTAIRLTLIRNVARLSRVQSSMILPFHFMPIP